MTDQSKFTPIALTDEQEAWFQKHFKHTKNEEIAQRLGISVRSVTRKASKMGLQKTKQFIRKCQLNAAQKANESNRINGTYPPKGYKIPNGEQYRFKKGERPIDRIGAKREAERISKSAESRRATFKLEKARALYGLPRQTKLKVVQRPRKQVHMRYYFRQLGYIVERGSNVVYYNSETKRSLKLESRPRTGFTFLEHDATNLQGLHRTEASPADLS